jgi:hypothetical protein
MNNAIFIYRFVYFIVFENFCYCYFPFYLYFSNKLNLKTGSKVISWIHTKYYIDAIYQIITDNK